MGSLPSALGPRAMLAISCPLWMLAALAAPAAAGPLCWWPLNPCKRGIIPTIPGPEHPCHPNSHLWVSCCTQTQSINESSTPSPAQGIKNSSSSKWGICAQSFTGDTFIVPTHPWVEGWEGTDAVKGGFHCTPSSEMFPAKTSPGKEASDGEAGEEPAGAGITSVKSSQAGTDTSQEHEFWIFTVGPFWVQLKCCTSCSWKKRHRKAVSRFHLGMHPDPPAITGCCRDEQISEQNPHTFEESYFQLIPLVLWGVPASGRASQPCAMLSSAPLAGQPCFFKGSCKDPASWQGKVGILLPCPPQPHTHPQPGPCPGFTLPGHGYNFEWGKVSTSQNSLIILRMLSY